MSARQPTSRSANSSPVGGIEVDQYQTGSSRAEHGQEPFETVRCPDADALPRPQAGRHQAARNLLDLAVQFRKAESNRLMRDDERGAIGSLLRGASEYGIDGTVLERPIADAGYEACC